MNDAAVIQVLPAAGGFADEPGADEVWRLPAAHLLERLGSTAAGLDGTEVQARLRRFGPNDAADVKRQPLWLQFLARFRNPLVIILLVASGLSAATGDVASFVIVVSIVTAQHHARFRPGGARAERGRGAAPVGGGAGHAYGATALPISVPIDQLVPGDIVELIAGDLVPADARLLESRDLFVNQALLTGEPYPAEKHASDAAPGTDKPDRRIERGVRRHLGDQRHRDRFWSAAPAPGRRSAHLATSLAEKPPATAFAVGIRRFGMLIMRLHHVDGAVRAGGEHLLPPAGAGIADVRAGARRRADARAAADDRDGHAGPLGHGRWPSER